MRDGVWSIPLPLPSGSGMRYVNCYVFAGAGSLTLVDPGWAHEEGWDALRCGLESIGLDLVDVAAVLVTHVHPDHYGLAPRIRALTGATVRLHELDAEAARTSEGDDALVRRAESFLRWCGAPEHQVSGVAGELLRRGRVAEADLPDAPLSHSDLVTAGGSTLRAVWTPGHTPGHTCLYDEANRLLLTGDHVLPKVSPHVGVYHGRPASPLHGYLTSLAGLRDLEVEEVLPAHEYRFGDLDGRLDQLLAHHEHRLDEVLEVLAAQESSRTASTTWAVAERLRWSRAWDEMPPITRRSANGETLAHLRELERRGSVRCSEHEVAVWTVVRKSGD